MVHSETGITVVITANGEGARMKGLSPLPKHLLYYGGKRIVDHIRDAFPGLSVKVLTCYDTPGHDIIRCEGPTKTRKETLENIRGMKNVLICDCDIIPDKITELMINLNGISNDLIWFFESDCEKYGGLEISENSRLIAAKERGKGHKCRAAGLYFLKDVGETLDRMEDPNSLAAAMVGARTVLDDAIIRLGDIEDYTNAVR